MAKEVDEDDEGVEKQRKAKMKRSLLAGDVHGSYRTQENVNNWRKRPLFKRDGKYLSFESGREAASLLVDEARRRDPFQVDFLHAVQEASLDIAVMMEKAPKLAWVFKQLMEPERLVTFRIPWTDDQGNSRINRGYRIQYSSALGPYHGGLRFNPQLSHGTVRMLGWEQTMKNALTGYPIGGSRGGSDFDPSNKSLNEIRRFCHSFMTELSDFIGPDFDTLETDMGVGASEMAALHHSYQAIEGDDSTSENLFGACVLFPEASGFGSVYFAERALQVRFNDTLAGKKCLLSGSGTLARSSALKLLDKGALPITFSDSTGYIVDTENGFSIGDIENIAKIKDSNATLKDYARSTKRTFIEAGSLWEQVRGDLAFPSHNYGEINADDSVLLADNGCIAVFENSDRACTSNAQLTLDERNVLHAPSKTVNSGSVFASALAGTGVTTKAEMDVKLRQEMRDLHDRVTETADTYGYEGNLRAGANILSFVTIANSPMYTNDH